MYCIYRDNMYREQLCQFNLGPVVHRRTRSTHPTPRCPACPRTSRSVPKPRGPTTAHPSPPGCSSCSTGTRSTNHLRSCATAVGGRCNARRVEARAAAAAAVAAPVSCRRRRHSTRRMRRPPCCLRTWSGFPRRRSSSPCPRADRPCSSCSGRRGCTGRPRSCAS
jgi:hypothetical protein